MRSLLWAYRYLRAQKKFLLLFTFNLSLGLLGFLFLESFRQSLRGVLDTSSKTFLSADLSLSARRLVQPAELEIARKIIGSDREESHLYEFFTMISPASKDLQTNARLVQLKAIEANFPLYGQLKMSSGAIVDPHSKNQLEANDSVWVAEDLLEPLGLKVGDSIRLGGSDFKIAESVVDDSTQTFRMAAISPKVYVSLNRIKKLGLVQFGTTFTEAILFKIPEQMNSTEIAKKIFKEMPDPSVQVSSHREASEESVKPLAYMGDYLGLVSLVALFLSLVGAVFLYRNFFVKQIKSFAIYSILGLDFRQVVLILIWQILFLGGCAFGFSIIFLSILLPFLQSLIGSLTPFVVPMQLSSNLVLIAFMLSTIGAIFIGGFYLLGLSQLRPAELFQEEFRSAFRVQILNLMYLVLPVGFFVVLAIYLAHSWKVGLLFCTLFILSLVLVLVLNFSIFSAVGKLLLNANWNMRQVGLQFLRKRRQTLASSAALSLGALLMTLLPQLRSSIQNDLRTPQGSTLPALFLFDIQDDQKISLETALADSGYSNLVFSPMVRARVLSVNGNRFEKNIELDRSKTREEEAENRFRNRAFNLSYRLNLDSSEKLVAGKFWQQPFLPESGGIPELSIEAHFAERLGFKLGDKLKFDIQGIEIEGQITNFRTVQWNSFKPNFFITFQPGALEEAPKTWLVSLPRIANSNGIQARLGKEFPNVSSVDVGHVIAKVLSMVDRMSWALQLMAFLCFTSGFFVLYSIVLQQVQDCRWDLNLQKILGAGFFESASQLWTQYALMGFVSSTVGGLVSFLVSGYLAKSLFEIEVVFDWWSLMGTVGGATVVAVIVSFIASWNVLRQRPQIVLQA